MSLDCGGGAVGWWVVGALVKLEKCWVTLLEMHLKGSYKDLGGVACRKTLGKEIGVTQEGDEHDDNTNTNSTYTS